MQRCLILAFACAVQLGMGCEPDVSPPRPADPGPTPAATDPDAPAVTEPVEPEIVIYAPPAVEDAQVVRVGKRVTLRLRWAKVEGAAKYQAQISKLLTFSRAVKDATQKKTLLVAPRLEPAVYFWRVRAVGDAGEGTWSDVQVLDATQSGQRGARKGRLALAREEEEPEPTPAAAPAGPEIPAVDPNTPLRLVWRLPLHQSVTTKSPAMVEGVATRGTVVQLGAAPPVTVASTFSLPFPLTHGRNELTLVATLGTQTKSLTRVVFYADPVRLAPIKQRFEELRTQLDEIGAIRDELATTMKTLETSLKGAKDQSRAAELKAEMTRINEIRREIDSEINNAIGDLDKLLGG